ncbi:DUF6973 domain-containing protein [Amycolatopsis sp. NPDC098790]|uniref:DUF6973 domain-containing protein n=1 Tax=Amycolatopsis sp. NPDC098790 TaxID=3363939 RepID=UPI00380EA351
MADDALAAARSSGLAGLHLGPADAFRHVLWNCQVAKRLGTARAEQFATAHENDDPSTIAFDNQKDLHNNATGRSVAGTKDCAAAVRAALAAGQLRTIQEPATRPHAVPPVSASRLGSSNHRGRRRTFARRRSRAGDSPAASLNIVGPVIHRMSARRAETSAPGDALRVCTRVVPRGLFRQPSVRPLVLQGRARSGDSGMSRCGPAERLADCIARWDAAIAER